MTFYRGLYNAAIHAISGINHYLNPFISAASGAYRFSREFGIIPDRFINSSNIARGVFATFGLLVSGYAAYKMHGNGDEFLNVYKEAGNFFLDAMKGIGYMIKEPSTRFVIGRDMAAENFANMAKTVCNGAGETARTIFPALVLWENLRGAYADLTGRPPRLWRRRRARGRRAAP